MFESKYIGLLKRCSGVVNNTKHRLRSKIIVIVIYIINVKQAVVTYITMQLVSILIVWLDNLKQS